MEMRSVSDGPSHRINWAVAYEGGALALRTMLQQRRMAAILGKENTEPAHSGAIFATSGIVGIEHGKAGRQGPRHRRALTVNMSSTVFTLCSPRWSAWPRLVTTATVATSKPRPSRKIPPRAASNTAASTCGLSRTLARAARAGAVPILDGAARHVDAVAGGHAHHAPS